MPVGAIRPSAFIVRHTSRTMSRLMPGQASSISESRQIFKLNIF
jgi:hypothetical protein